MPMCVRSLVTLVELTLASLLPLASCLRLLRVPWVVPCPVVVLPSFLKASGRGVLPQLRP